MAPLQVPSLTFNNGFFIPAVGLGTWKSKPGEVERAVQDAIDAGYRHLDCAYIYKNETEVGTGIRNRVEQKLIERGDLFVTSKLWNTFHRPDLVVPACKETLSKLGLQYLDLYLMHWPFAFKEGVDPLPQDSSGNIILSDVDYIDTWRQMEKCVQLGLVRSIGLSNFNSQQIDRVINMATVRPANLQVECNPYLAQSKLLDFCQSRGLVMTGYSPLGSPDSPYIKTETPRLLEDPKLQDIAERVSRSPGQVLIRYQVQRGMATVPKSVTKSRICQNIDVFDFELSDVDMGTLDSMDRNIRICHRDHAKNDKNYPFNIEF